jgi:hypothetical protein
MLLELQQLVIKKDETIHSLFQRFEVAKRKQYGKSSEQLPGSGETFNEAEEIIDEADKVILAIFAHPPIWFKVTVLIFLIAETLLGKKCCHVN